MTIFYYVIATDDRVLAYIREKKAQQVAGLYNTTIKLESDLTPEQIERAEDMYFL